MPDANTLLQILGDYSGASQSAPAIQTSSQTESRSDMDLKLDILKSKLSASSGAAPTSSSPIAKPESNSGSGAGDYLKSLAVPGSNANADPGALGAMSRSASDVMTLGISKPLNAALMAGVIDPIKNAVMGKDEGDFSQRYTRHMQEQQSRDAAIAAEHPYASSAGDALGLVGTLGIGGGSADAAATAAPASFSGKALSYAKNQILPSAGIGAAVGGINAAGYAPEGQRTDSGISGAVTGGVLGATIPPLVQGVGKLVSPLVTPVLERMNTPSAEMANRKIALGLARDQIDPSDIAKRLSDLGPNASLADVGGANTQGLGRAVAGLPGEGKELATQFLNQRQAGQGQRIADSVTSGLGTQKNFYDTVDELITHQKQSAGPLYSDAFAQNRTMDVPVINRILRTDAGKQALNIARQTMSDKMKLMSAIDPELTEQASLVGAKVKGGVGKGLTMETLDNVKKSLDTMYKTMSMSDNAAVRSRASGILDLKKSLINAMDEADVTAVRDKAGNIIKPGLYKQARSVWSDDESLKGALEAGRAFINQDAEMTARQLADMSDAEKNMFRAGATKAVLDKIKNTPFGSDATKNVYGNAEQLFGSAAKRDRLKELFPDAQSYNNFEKNMLAEAKMYQTRAQTLQGSRTAPMAAEIADTIDVPSAGMALAKGNYTEAALHFGKNVFDRLFGLPAGTREEIAQKLFTNDAQKNKDIVDAIEKLMIANQQPTRQLPMIGLAGEIARPAAYLPAPSGQQ